MSELRANEFFVFVAMPGAGAETLAQFLCEKAIARGGEVPPFFSPLLPLRRACVRHLQGRWLYRPTAG